MIALLSLMIKAFKLKIHYAKAWSTKIVYEHVFEIKIQRKRKIILKTKLNFKGFYDISHHCASEMKYWLTWSAWRENCWNKSKHVWGVLKEEFKQPFHRLSISTNIDRFRQVDKCRSHQCIIIKLPYLSWEKKHPRLIISCQDRMIWYDERTEFFLFKREVIEWTVSASWNSARHIVS